jgi:hypothetical protein
MLSVSSDAEGRRRLSPPAVGVDYESVRKLSRWSRQRVRGEILHLQKQGVDLSCRAMFAQGHGVVVSMGCFYFGSWKEAVSKAGIDYEHVRKPPGPKGRKD